jgi:type IV pili sensor histidine kinase/response regulator
MNNLLTIVAAGFIAMGAANCYANQTQVGRYLTVTEGANVSQSEPLQQSFMLNIPGEINTVGGAMSYLLNNSGFSLLPIKYRDTDTETLLTQKLPLSDRSLGPMTVMQALIALSGDAYVVLVDPQHRYISFMLRPRFQNLYSSNFNN